MKKSTLPVLAAVLVLSLGAAPRPAEAGLCKKQGLSKQCVVKKDIKKNAIGSGQVKDESLTGSDIRNGSLGGADMQDGGLTGADIQDGSVTGSDVQDGSLGGAEVQDGGLSGTDIQDGSIANVDLADDAVTPNDLLSRTLVVAPAGDGSDATMNGDELLDAIAFLGTVSPAPGAANPWLIKLEPGVYDVGATSVQLLPYVDLEGAGQGVAEITGTVDNTILGVVIMADNTEIRQVTVTNAGGVNSAITIAGLGDPIRISDTTARASAGTTFTVGLSASSCGDLTLVNVTATATAAAGIRRGADLRCSSTVATNLTATGDLQGLTGLGTTTLIRNSNLTGGIRSVENFSGSLNVVHSQLTGSVFVSGGTLTCFGAYDAGLTALNATCN